MPLSAPRWNKGETKKKRISQEVIITTRGFGLVSQTKIAYGDFMKRPTSCWGLSFTIH